LTFVLEKTKSCNNLLCRKSQIAIEYCYRYREIHPEAHVFWVHASTPARFTVAYQRIGEELALPDVNNPDVDTIELVQKWLSNDANGPWLLALDSADDIEIIFGSTEAEQQLRALFSYLPQSSNGSIVVTTRDKRVGQRLAPLEKPITILPFEMKDAKHLLQKTLHEDELDQEHSTALLEALEFLPMAITQAAAFIRENGISLSEYLGLLRASDEEAKNLLAETYHDPGRDQESQNSVFQTWKISFDCIKKQKPRAADILALMAVLDRQAIPKILLCKDNESEIGFATAMGTLKAFSLVTEEEAKGTFGMHRLIQLSTQKWLDLEGVLGKWQKKAVDVVSGLCTEDDVFIGDWKIWGSISPHAQVVLSFEFQSEPFLLERAIILHRLAIHELEEGYIVNADARAQEALATIQKLEIQHPKKLAIAKTVASVLSSQGKFEASEKIHRKVLEERQAILGSNHPETLMSLDCIAYTLCKQGKYEQAEVLERQIVEAWKTLPELATHTFRFTCYTSLAYALEMQCKYGEAEETIKKAIDGHTEIFGAEHPFTTVNLCHLSSVLMKQDKLEAAEAIARKALQDYEYSLGPQHRYTLGSLGHIARIYDTQDKFEEAERLKRRVCDGLETLLGLEHQETIWALDDLAYTLVKQNKYQEAESVLRRGGRGRETSGPELESTLFGVSFLAQILEIQKKFEEAEHLRRRALNVSESLHGPEHVETLQPLFSLAYVLDKQGKDEEAESALRQAVRICEDKLGPQDRRTLTALTGLATLLEGQAKYLESEAVSLRAFRAYEIASGHTHSDTIISLAHVAMAMVKQGKFEAVEEMCRPLLDGYQEVLGSEHSALMSLLDYVAEALAKLGKYEEAELLSRCASKSCEKALGFEHPSTIATLNTLMSILDKQEKYEAAEAVRRRVLECQEKVLGPDHVDTAVTVYGLAWTLHARSDYDQASALYQRAWAGLQKTLGSDYVVAIACSEGLAALKIIRQNQRLLSPRYFPRLRRFIRPLTRSKEGHRRYKSNPGRQV
jgi:tetratricopeptide (TPR) repeat protein